MVPAVLPLADLGKLQGMKAGMQEPISMIDGKTWNGAKAYKVFDFSFIFLVCFVHFYLILFYFYLSFLVVFFWHSIFSTPKKLPAVDFFLSA